MLYNSPRRVQVFAKLLLIAFILVSLPAQAINRATGPLQIEPFAFCIVDNCKVSITISNLTPYEIALDTSSINAISIAEAGLNVFDATKFPKNYEYIDFDIYSKKIENIHPFKNSSPSELYRLNLEPYQKVTREINNLHGLFKFKSHGDYLLNYVLFAHKLYVDGNLVEGNQTFISGYTTIYGYRKPVKSLYNKPLK